MSKPRRGSTQADELIDEQFATNGAGRSQLHKASWITPIQLNGGEKPLDICIPASLLISIALYTPRYPLAPVPLRPGSAVGSLDSGYTSSLRMISGDFSSHFSSASFSERTSHSLRAIGTVRWAAAELGISIWTLGDTLRPWMRGVRGGCGPKNS